MEHAAAISYLGPMSPIRTIEYLEQTYGEPTASFRSEITAFCASADTFRALEFVRLHERMGSYSM